MVFGAGFAVTKPLPPEERRARAEARVTAAKARRSENVNAWTLRHAKPAVEASALERVVVPADPAELRAWALAGCAKLAGCDSVDPGTRIKAYAVTLSACQAIIEEGSARKMGEQNELQGLSADEAKARLKEHALDVLRRLGVQVSIVEPAQLGEGR